ncbi:unnamed protein product [Moneuplotes crassus]|uniref:Nucleotide-sugar transporter n=1 Tax=Euplotes crassus TaxID=5936 RepID=A0AAD1XG46_EUPCR|nr:unnamed protein product [Moneuplotes crassus]
MNLNTINPILLVLFCVLMILSTSSQGILLKLQSNVTVDGSRFEHPFFLTLIIFMGESLCIFLYLLEKAYLAYRYGRADLSPEMIEAQNKGKRTDINPLLMAIPMLCDSTATPLYMLAYINIPASIGQMMSALVIFVVALLSILFFGRKYYRHHWLGLILVFVGICLVAISALISSKGSGTTGNVPLGVILMIFSVFAIGSQYVVEEKLLSSYYLSPFKAAGWEGITGTILWCVLLIIFQFIPCEAQICNNGRLENTSVAFEFMAQSTQLKIFLVGNLLLTACMSGFSLLVTKYASATAKVILKQTKIVIVWLFFLIYRGGGHETFHVLQLIGFVLLCAGIILFNEIIIIPVLGFNKNTKARLTQRRMVSSPSVLKDELSESLCQSETIYLMNDETENCSSF